ncbi:type II toxin-antitoxin system VapC family toxin [Mycolicibacterium sp. XJ870]
MAGLVVVDTDLVIDFLRGKGIGVSLVRDLISSRRIRFTAVTAFELRTGTDFHRRHADIVKLLKSRTLPLDIAAGLQAGEAASFLRDAGTPIGFADCLQAGICIRNQLPFATRNRRHFERIPQLDLVDLASV